MFRDKIHNEATQDFERSLAEEKAKHAKAVKEHEERISELKKAHQTQSDELCREVLKANLEADRLHSQLNNGSPRKTKLFSRGSRGSRGGNVIPVIFSILAPIAVSTYLL